MMFKSIAVLLIVSGVYEIAGALLNFRGFWFKKNLKVREFQSCLGTVGARIAFLLFGLATGAAGTAILLGYFGEL